MADNAAFFWIVLCMVLKRNKMRLATESVHLNSQVADESAIGVRPNFLILSWLYTNGNRTAKKIFEQNLNQIFLKINFFIGYLIVLDKRLVIIVMETSCINWRQLILIHSDWRTWSWRQSSFLRLHWRQLTLTNVNWT